MGEAGITRASIAPLFVIGNAGCLEPQCTEKLATEVSHPTRSLSLGHVRDQSSNSWKNVKGLTNCALNRPKQMFTVLSPTAKVVRVVPDGKRAHRFAGHCGSPMVTSRRFASFDCVGLRFRLLTLLLKVQGHLDMKERWGWCLQHVT